MMKTEQMRNKWRILSMGLMCFFFTLNLKAQDGQALFDQNCGACHRLSSDRMVGPGLQGINEKRSEEWLISWIKDSEALINSGDADAISIFEEYNKIPMTNFKQLSDADIKALLSIIPANESAGDEAGDVAEVEEAEPVAPIEYTEEDVAMGRDLFTGSKRFVNRGPSCMTCHNVNNDEIFAGGVLAKDLTNVYGRMGDVGVSATIGNPSFRPMAIAYENNKLNEEEVFQLTAFLKHADAVSETQEVKSRMGLLLGGGSIGLAVWLIIIYLNWMSRKKESVKHDILHRQIKGSDSVAS